MCKCSLALILMHSSALVSVKETSGECYCQNERIKGEYFQRRLTFVYYLWNRAEAMVKMSGRNRHCGPNKATASLPCEKPPDSLKEAFFVCGYSEPFPAS